jgi:putative endonuclease
MTKHGYIYILANEPFGTIYVGVTSNLIKRIYEHKEKLVEGFTKKYDLNRLVYYEICEDITTAVIREKQLKKIGRKRKLELITNFNKKWEDLYMTII